MHVYWRTGEMHELKKTVNGRTTIDIKEPSAAVIVWDIPYRNASPSSHPGGINLLFADTYAAFEKRDPKKYD